MNTLEIMMGLCVGVAMAAACGFRVFVPLLVLSAGSRAGLVNLHEGFAWMGENPALIAFSVATAVEIAAYFVPWIDHALDSISAPAAVVAGTLITASQFGSLDPTLQWITGVVAGGGAAGVSSVINVAGRGFSTASTGGLLNPVISAIQSVVAISLSLVTLLIPVVVGITLLALVATMVGVLVWRRSRRDTRQVDSSRGAFFEPTPSVSRRAAAA